MPVGARIGMLEIMKIQHRCGSQAENACKGPPMLEFIHLIIAK